MSCTRLILAAYDLVALQLSAPLVWRCPVARLLRHYDEHVSGAHRDIGVGTGFFLDK